MPNYATIHHFFPHPLTGFYNLDEDGDPILGWYFEILDGEDEPISEMMGPYNSPEEAEEACQHAFDIGDY